MNLSILIPWKPDCGHRDRLLDWIVRRYQLLLPGAQICLGSNNDEPFNRAKARNDAFSQAKHDTLLIADADTTFPTSDSIHVAIDALSHVPWFLPYDVYYNMAQEDTETLLEQNAASDIDMPANYEFRLTTAISGLLVVPRSGFVAAGGYDERFVGWGYEDNAFQMALDTLHGPHRRLPGYVLHLWHPVAPNSGFSSPTIYDSQARWVNYRSAEGHPDKMRQLVA